MRQCGACYHGEGKCAFTVWAPFLSEVALEIVAPAERRVPMTRDGGGYWTADPGDVAPGTRYFYRLGAGPRRPDPASAFQPEGVHGPSEVVDHGAFRWSEGAWRGSMLEEMVIYELHVGTFTADGTFEAAIPRLDELKSLGINAVEIMPVAQFPGGRNWGYDGVYPFAVQNSYGGPQGLKALVAACHARGMAVVLDVVYNHLGPEGNYLAEYGPYFTGKYQTPWGRAVNFDDTGCEGVRNYFIGNALSWFRQYHIDALRLDAVHGIYDESPAHILKELAEAAREYSREAGRRFVLIAESDLNDVKIVRPLSEGGYGIDAQWSDDFHHALHTLLTAEADGYYADFGPTGALVKAFREGFVYTGQYSPFRKKNHGTPSAGRPALQFVVFSQNHDQVGNRVFGERLSKLVPFEALKLAAGAVLVSPYIPLVFMGEEYGEDAPFLYFVSHSDEYLIRKIREGRKGEFKEFDWKDEPPDPQAEATFIRSKLDWPKRNEAKHKELLAFYGRLLQLRKDLPALACRDKERLKATDDAARQVIFLSRWCGASRVFCVMHFHGKEQAVPVVFPEGKWRLVLDSSREEWGGPGSAAPETAAGHRELALAPYAFCVYTTEA